MFWCPARDCSLRRHRRRVVDDHWLRSRIAYLPQNPALFEGTVFENLTGFDPSPERVIRVEEVAEELGLTAAISKLPLGFQTEIRSGGTEALPASIRQQIPIVRALALDPDIILMDECNSNLDHDADLLFRSALESRRSSATIVLITPRPSFQLLARRDIKMSDIVGATDIDIAAEDVSPTLSLASGKQARNSRDATRRGAS